MRTLKAMLILIFLLAAGAAAGWGVHVFLAAPLAISVCKWLGGVFGVVWAAMLWLMPKVEDITDSSGLSYEQHRRLDPIARHKMIVIKRLAFLNILAALLAFTPEALQTAKLPMPAWLLPLVGGALGFALFGIWLFFEWREEIRVFRSKLKEQERLQAARDKALAALKGKDSEQPSPDTRLDGFRNDPKSSDKFPNGEHPA